MKIEIKYNSQKDEFTNDLSLEMRLTEYIKNHFYPAYIISMLAPTYLLGGAIRDLIDAKHPKDLDFVILGDENKSWMLEVLNKFNIKYQQNKLGGLKFKYQDTTVDMWTSDDLFASIQYNIDGLLFELNTNKLISLTFNDYQEQGLIEINKQNNIQNGREEKLKAFTKSHQKR